MNNKYLQLSLLLVLALLCANPVCGQKPLKRPPKPNTSTSTTTKKPSQSTSTNKPSNSSITSSEPKTTSSATGTINGHEWVNLGLSVKWATCNVGASSPSDYGYYYAWGETQIKVSYTEDNCFTSGKNFSSIAGNPQYDAARANWGSTWRIPTKEEIDELVNKCTWTWTAQGGHFGFRVTGLNGNSIFLPAAGYRYGMALNYAGEGGYYWSATPDKVNVSSAYDLGFYNGNVDRNWLYRYNGRSVRPVSE